MNYIRGKSLKASLVHVQPLEGAGHCLTPGVSFKDNKPTFLILVSEWHNSVLIYVAVSRVGEMFSTCTTIKKFGVT